MLRATRFAFLLASTSCFSLFAGSLGAQTTAVLTGVVVDSLSRPLGGAIIRIAAMRAQTTSDAGGRFRFAELPLGRHLLDVSRLGFGSREHHVEVSAGATASLTIRLSQAVTTLGAVVVREEVPPGSVRPAPDLSGTMVLAGVKTEFLRMTRMDANLSEKVPRQISRGSPVCSSMTWTAPGTRSTSLRAGSTRTDPGR